MKKYIFILFVVASVVIEAGIRDRMDFNYFYNTLEPYGQWISFNDDLVVWRPSSVHADWQPYSIGRWSWTDYGWYWDSYEPFGWATYHYGRWVYDNYYGWIWMPDYEWGPAWVEWRYNENYIGWAPLPNYASFDINFGIHFSIGWNSPYHFWNFVSYRDFCTPHINRFIVEHKHVKNFFYNTEYKTNYYWNRDRVFNGGIDRRLIEQRGENRLKERRISAYSDRENFIRMSENDDNIRTFIPNRQEFEKYGKDNKVEFRRSQRDLDVLIGKNPVDKNDKDNNTGERRPIRNPRQIIESKPTTNGIYDSPGSKNDSEKLRKDNNPIQRNSGEEKYPRRDKFQGSVLDRSNSDKNDNINNPSRVNRQNKPEGSNSQIGGNRQDRIAKSNPQKPQSSGSTDRKEVRTKSRR